MRDPTQNQQEIQLAELSPNYDPKEILRNNDLLS